MYVCNLLVNYNKVYWILTLLSLLFYFISQWICTPILNNLVGETLTGLCFSWNFMVYNLHIWAIKSQGKSCPQYLHICSLFVFLKIVAVVGGMAPQKQQRLLRKCPEIIVATPGRLWDLISEVSTFRHKFPICWVKPYITTLLHALLVLRY